LRKAQVMGVAGGGVRRPGWSAVRQIVHAGDRECAAARDGARPICPPAKMASRILLSA
jgi:hypothetical protein